MRIGGFQKLTLSDFDGRPSAIVFTQGCNFRCPFCHNPGLVQELTHSPCIYEDEVFDYLTKRSDLLSGVVITGGEPCLQQGLLDFSRRVKDMGLLVKLDTNGSNPDVLERLMVEKLVDYIAMDLKAPRAKYDRLAGCRAVTPRIQESVQLILRSDIAHEFRTTAVSPALTEEDILSIAAWIKGARRYVLQTFIPTVTLDPTFQKARAFSASKMIALCKHITGGGLPCSIR